MSDNVTPLTDEQLEIARMMLAKQDEEKENMNKANDTLSNGEIEYSETITVVDELVFEEPNNSQNIEVSNIPNEETTTPEKIDAEEEKHTIDISKEIREDIPKSPSNVLGKYKPKEEETHNSSQEIEEDDPDVTNFIMGNHEKVKEKEPIAEENKEEPTENEGSVKNENPNDFSDISDVVVEEVPSIVDREYHDVYYDVVNMDKYKGSDFDFGIFGSKSKYESKKKDVKNPELRTVSQFLVNVKNRTHKGAIKRGMFIDYYMPTSNLVFRTYELSNDIILAQLQTLLMPDMATHKDEGDNLSNEEFVDLVLKHTDVLCSDGDTLTNYSIKNKISNADIETMKLAVGVLMFIIKNDSEEERKGVYTDPEVKFDSLQCEKCNHTDSYKINMRESLKSIYTEEIIDHALKNFSFDKTFDELIASSIRSKGKGANYLDKETQILYRATIADPSYDDMKSDYNKMYDYIINKYDSYVADDKKSEFYERNTLRDKYYEMVSIIGSISNELAENIEQDFNGLIIYSYVKEMFLYDVPDEMVDRKITKEDLKTLQEKHVIEPSYNSFDSTIDDFLSILQVLPTKFTENINLAIVNCQKNQKINFTVTYKCTKCEHENKGTLDGTSLLGFRITNQQDS